MCIILLALDCHPRYRLIIAANRDEFYARPARPAGFWEDAPWVLAGRDLQEGGTWLGLSRGGGVGLLTNIRNPAAHRPQAPSRGRLVETYLREEPEPQAYLQRLEEIGPSYNGFNLIFGTAEALYYYNNRLGSGRPLSPGIFGLSNDSLDSGWPKVARGRELMSRVVRRGEDVSFEELLDILSDESRPADELLPETGVGLEKERLLSPIFIQSPDYGTRASTVILIDRDGRADFLEKTHPPPGEKKGASAWDAPVMHYRFTIQPL